MHELFRKDPEELPQTSRLLALLLSNSIQDFDTRVLAQLQEVINTYTLQILQEATVLQHHANNIALSAQDVKLAIEFKSSIEYTNVPSRTSLMELAKKKNSIPLPLVTEKFGLRLPPERHCLIKRNITIVPKKRDVQEVIDFNKMNQNLSEIVNNGPSMTSMMKSVPLASTEQTEDDDYDMDGIDI